MKKDDICGKCFSVSILKRGSDGDTLCYRVQNDILGDFDILNCHFNTDPAYFKGAKNHLNGNTSIETEDNGVCDYFVVLTICYEDPKKGIVMLRC